MVASVTGVRYRLREVFSVRKKDEKVGELFNLLFSDGLKDKDK
jgi:hypothetical protein